MSNSKELNLKHLQNNILPSKSNEIQINNSFLAPEYSISNMDKYFVRSSILREISTILPELKGTLLDLGCGEMPYRKILTSLSSKVDKYIGLDIENPLYQQNVKPDLYWDGSKIPLESNSIDCVVATEFLEHIPDPVKVLSEVNRVLKTGGLFFFTVPFLWSLHSIPNDEYRYTPFAMERILKSALFCEIKIRALGGWNASLAQILGLWVRRKPMSDDSRNYYSKKFFPFYKCLIESDEIPENFSEGLLVPGLSGTAKKKMELNIDTVNEKEVTETDQLNENYTLAIFTPNFGSLSETFIQKHIKHLLPGKTIVVTGTVYDPNWINVPYIQIPFSTGPAKYSEDVESKVLSFLYIHKVTHILVEYGCHGTEIVELNNRQLRLPLFVHFHGGDASLMLRRNDMVEYYRWMGQKVSGVITVAEPMTRRLCNLGIPGNKIHINHYGIDVPEKPIPHAKSQICRFVFVGRLVPKKAPDMLIKAFTLAYRRNNNIHLDIIGGHFTLGVASDYQRYLEKLVIENKLNDAVTIHGSRENYYVKSMLPLSDVYVQHSVTVPETGDAEGLPNSILEASANCLPIISTFHEGIPEEVENFKTGFLVEEFDYEKMAEYMIRLSEDYDLRKKMGEAGREKVENEFTTMFSIKNLRKIIFNHSINNQSDENMSETNLKISIAKAEELINREDYKSAENLLDSQILKYPNNIDLLNDLAVVSLYQRQWQKAAEIFKKIIDIDPTNEVASENIAYLEDQLENCSPKKLYAGDIPDLHDEYDHRVQNPPMPLSIALSGKAIRKNDEGLPIHFFTIVLNGRPFIEYHINIFKELPFKWHWHIVEGVADFKHDTECHFIRGGGIPENFNIDGLSVDGTSAYLDNLKQEYPQNVSIYRKDAGEYWDGKLEMVNAPIKNIDEECLLWQIDVDEFWDIDKICKARELFLANPDKTAAFYYCIYFVGDGLYISSTNTYGNYTDYEWIRTWRYKLGCRWTSHAPPKLCIEIDNSFKNLSEINPLMHTETFENNLVFKHYAYTIPKQLEFKEKYYGYKDALNQWYRLQLVKSFPVYLRDYFDWVKDDAIVERVDNEEYTLKFILSQYEIELAEEFTAYLGERNIIQDEKEKHLSNDDTASAETRLFEILKEDPFNSDALNDLSVINASRHNYDLSLKLLNEAIKIFPDNETIKTNLETIKSFANSQIISNSINREDIFSIKTKKYIDILEKKRAQGFNSRAKKELSFQLNFDFNDGCNLNCIMCGNVPNKNYKNQNIMEYSVFVNRFLPTIKYANTFQYGCFYEPLMVPYFIDSLWLMKAVIRPDAKGNMITNGTLLTSDKIKAIIDSDLFDKVRCSIDSVNPELFSRIRFGAKFEKVLNHLEELSAYRTNKGSKCKLELNFTIMRDNIAELPELILLAKKLGIDSITTHKLAPTEIAFVDNDKLEIYSKNIKQAEEIAKELNISFSGQKYLSKADYELIKNNKIEKSCGYFKRNFVLLTIFANGNISTSCHRSGEILGNLNNENFEDIIHGSRFNVLRSAIEETDSEICANCHMYQ